MVIEHIIAGYSIPHNEGAIPLTKEAYDVNNPQKRLSDYSKTITIPEGKLVNQIFEHAFDVNVDFLTFNPNLKTSYQILQDGVLVIDGYCQLLSIKDVDGLVTYEIAATGKVGNLFEKIKDKYLQDLDLSSLDHAWNQSNIEDSWTAPIGEGYVYPMIDIGNRSRYDLWTIQEFKPAIYLKQYLDSILSEAGYTYDSTFFDTTLFKSLIIPYGSGKIPLDNDAILCREFNIDRTSNQTIQCQDFTSYSNSENSIMVFNNATIAEYFNTCLDEFDVTTGKFVAQESNSMSFQGVINFDMIYTQSSENVTRSLNAITQSPLNASSKSYVNCYLWKNEGGVYTTLEHLKLDFSEQARAVDLPLSFAPTPILDISVAFNTGNIVTEIGTEYFISVGDVVYSGLSASTGALGAPPIYRTSFIVNYQDFKLVLKPNSTFASKLAETEIGVGDVITTRLVIPKQIKQSDLLSSIIKRFNLYIDYDPLNDNNLIIETRDDFLTTDRVDLEQIVDRSRDYLIKPLGALDAGRFIFTDLIDTDYHNDLYNKVNNEVYGQVIVDVDNDFVTSDKIISSIFAATPLGSTDDNDRILASMKFVNQNNEESSATAKIRLLYYGGLLNTQAKWFLESAQKTQYPYAGHLDNPYAPTFDLNWGVPKQLLYNFNYGKVYTITYTNTNCYNFFWKRYIEEITDKNSKLLECYLALRPYDYNELSFRKNYYIDGSYWRLLSVTDYDATSNQTTKCTFLKVEPKNAFVGEIKPVYGGVGQWEDGNDLPLADTMVRPNNNSGKTQDTLQFGESIKGGTRSIIASDNVKQSLNSKNALVIGSDYSEVNADNVTIINSPYTNVIRPDETYINGLFVEKLASIVVPTSVLENLTQGFEVLPTLAADEFYQITRGYIRLNGDPATTGKKLELQVSVEGHSLASIKAAFFNTANNVGYIDEDAHIEADIHFGESVILINPTTDMTFPSGETTLTINLVYRIIRL